jgi:glucokinase
MHQPPNPIAIGIDVGGTRIKAGVADQNGRVLERHVEPTPSSAPITQLDAALKRIATSLLKKHPSAHCVGLSLTGPTDPTRGVVYLPGKISGLEGHPLVPNLSRALKLPVTADNDGRLAALAEWRVGAGVGSANLVVLTLGTGIGSGVVLNGTLLRDSSFLLGTQIGHFVIERDGAPCLTGGRGTGEALASVTALMSTVRDALSRGLPSSLLKIQKEQLNFEALVAALRKKDPLAVALFERWLDRLAAVILNATHAYCPQRVLIAGGPSAAADLLLKPLQRRVESQAFRYPAKKRLPIRAAITGNDASWLGASLFALDSFRGPA